ncbi:MAG: nickel-responsive transcriptional regulator NikR, partial [Sedimentisphaerales bacterium]|nr:nickel-responsive transcriptional regulator NikR [Sedimentisphaerales bacterium]
MEKMQRVGISLEAGLLEKFDDLIEIQGYENRSEAVRDLIRQRITEKQLADPKTDAVAAVFVVYDHHQNVAQKLTRLQHNELLKTISSMHVHLGHHDCLEVILLKGKVKEIRKLADNIVSL